MTESPVETTPNIGKVLGQRMVQSASKRARSWSGSAMPKPSRLTQKYPEDACPHTRLALAGATRSVRWHDLSDKIKQDVTKGLDS